MVFSPSPSPASGSNPVASGSLTSSLPLSTATGSVLCSLLEEQAAMLAPATTDNTKKSESDPARMRLIIARRALFAVRTDVRVRPALTGAHPLGQDLLVVSRVTRLPDPAVIRVGLGLGVDEGLVQRGR